MRSGLESGEDAFYTPEGVTLEQHRITAEKPRVAEINALVQEKSLPVPNRKARMPWAELVQSWLLPGIFRGAARGTHALTKLISLSNAAAAVERNSPVFAATSVCLWSVSLQVSTLGGLLHRFASFLLMQ
jgi:hypothetical protein